MNPYSKIVLPVAALAALCAACTEDTGTLGIYDKADAIATTTHTFSCTSSSVLLDSVRANSDKCYIGQIVDPETGAILKADFVAQFHSFETGIMPASYRIVSDENGDFICDSVNIRVFFQKYYGDGTAPFKMQVHELSMQEDRMLSEDSVYFTNVNLSNFVATPEELEQRKVGDEVFWPVTKMFTPIDYTESDSTLNSSSHYNNISISLPAAYGKRIINLYRTHPEYFSSSYTFVRNVCPGFYFNVLDGEGAMMTVDVSSLDVYYRYRPNEKDTLQGVCRFSATGEVIQATHFYGGGNEALVADPTCTYLKSPAGIGTVLTLPVEEIFSGHENDSIALASITMTRYNVDEEDREFALSPCSAVAMIERSEINRFFEAGYTRNPRAYAIAQLSSGYNIYSFSNIGRLISYLYEKRQNSAVSDPYWNQVVLVPVTVTTNSSNQLVNVSSEMSITSTRLVGGTNGTPINLQVVYSSYGKQ